MSIINNLKLAVAAVVIDQTRHSLNLDPTNPESGKLGPRVNSMAVEALLHGSESDEWKEYMKLFASNEKELARLAGAGDTEPWLKQQRAYLVTTFICDPGTQGKNMDRVSSDINLPDADAQPDETFIATRKVKFPPI